MAKRGKDISAHPQPDGPALLKPGHVRSRVLSTVAGAPKGFRNEREHPLSIAEAKGWIDGNEFAAGECYRAFFEKMARSGVDSLELIGGGSSGTPWTQAQAEAIRTIRDIEDNLEKLDRDFPKANWVVMVRKFCGEGYSVTAAVRAAGYVNPRFTRHRIKLALNKLSLAISKTKIEFRPSE